MKKIIINRSQLKEMIDKNIQEDVDIAVKANNNSGSDYLNALKNPNTTKDIQQAKSITPDVNAVISGPKTDDNSPSIDCDVPAGSNVSDVINKNPEIGNAIGNKSARLVVHGDGFPNESKIYSKKNVEIARLSEMRKNGKIMTKKQLTESLLGNDDIENLIRKKNSFEVLEAFGDVFGDDALQQLSTTWDMVSKIMEVYNNADMQQQELFKQKLTGEQQEEEPLDLDFDV